MVKRIITLPELRKVLDFFVASPKVDQIFSRMKHVNGEWDKKVITENLTFILANQPKDSLFLVSYTKNEPTAAFFGFVTNDFVTGKRGVNELLWFSIGTNPIGGVKVLRAVEKFAKEQSLSYICMSLISNGGGMGLAAFYARNGYALDSLSFIKTLN